MSPPVLSICIPTFDRLEYLREAVASARAQTRQDVEIVIGDDGESKELADWCRAVAAIDVRVRYEKTPRRLGLAGNWNFLAGLARAPYVTLIGDDDRLLPTFAEKLVSASQPDADVIFCNHHIIDKRGRRLDDLTRQFAESYGRATLRAGRLKQPALLIWRGVVPMSAAAVRTAEVRRLGFKNDINTPELELFVRMTADGGKFDFVADYLAEYRSHGGSATTSGLTIDRLAEYLEAVAVPADIEAAKRACLQPLLLGGVSLRLRRGNLAGARSLAASPYYPRSLLQPRAQAQRIFLALPARVARPVYSSLTRVVQTLRGTLARRRLDARQ